MELRTLLSVLADHPDFKLEAAEFSHLQGGHHLGLHTLPVRFATAGEGVA